MMLYRSIRTSGIAMSRTGFSADVGCKNEGFESLDTTTWGIAGDFLGNLGDMALDAERKREVLGLGGTEFNVKALGLLSTVG